MRALTPIALVVALSSGCTLLLDRDRHRGGEPNDADPALTLDAATDAGTPPGDAAPDAASDAAPDAARSDDAGTDATSAPDAPEEDGGPACDADGDGYDAAWCGGDDCDDTDAAVHPLAPPVCGNGRIESCVLDGQSELLGALGAAEVGVLPRVVVSHDAVASDVAGGVTSGFAAPAGMAWVVHRVRGATTYVAHVTQIDLATGAVTDLTPVFGLDQVFAHAVGAGDLGGVADAAASLALVTTTPDDDKLRGNWLTGSADGLTGSAPVSFDAVATRGVAVVGDGSARALVFAADDRLVRYSLMDGSVLEAPMSAPFAVPYVRGDGAGPYALFVGTTPWIWDLTEKPCSVGVPCSGASTCDLAVGRCTPQPPRAVALDTWSGWIDVAYAAGALWFTQPSPIPGVVQVGLLTCGADPCVVASSASLVLSDRSAERPDVEPVADDLVAVVAAVATDAGAGIRVAFHQPSTGRQIGISAAADGLDLLDDVGVVEGLHTARTTHDDPRYGRVTTLFVTAATPGEPDTIVATGLRACASP